MAFRFKVHMWQYWLCNKNVSGAAEVDILRGRNAVLHAGLKYVGGRKNTKRTPTMVMSFFLLLLLSQVQLLLDNARVVLGCFGTAGPVGLPDLLPSK